MSRKNNRQANFFCAEVACWTITGERQATHIRSLYLKSVLRQDISFFDVEMTTGQIVSRMSGDTVLVQDAIGEKVTSSSKSNEEHISKLVFITFQLI
jgi:ABC-type multidrug transport system fused ATPase/permease subunit